MSKSTLLSISQHESGNIVLPYNTKSATHPRVHTFSIGTGGVACPWHQLCVQGRVLVAPPLLTHILPSPGEMGSFTQLLLSDQR